MKKYNSSSMMDTKNSKAKKATYPVTPKRDKGSASKSKHGGVCKEPGMIKTFNGEKY